MTEEKNSPPPQSSNDIKTEGFPRDQAGGGQVGEHANSSTSSEEGAAPVEEVDPLTEALNQAGQFKEKLMRTAADFDNYRKRSRREVSDAEKKGRDGLLKELLPVFDNLERATAHADAVTNAVESSADHETGPVKALIDGITLVRKQFTDALGRLGIERVESMGQPFDPSVHEAIQHLETSDVPVGCIAAEVQSGYRQGDRLVRPAMVVVAKAPAATPNDGGAETQDSASTLS